MEPRKLSELRSLVLKKPELTTHPSADGSIIKQLSDLEARIKNLELLIRTKQSGGPSSAPLTTAPPSYNTSEIRGPARPLF